MCNENTFPSNREKKEVFLLVCFLNLSSSLSYLLEKENSGVDHLEDGKNHPCLTLESVTYIFFFPRRFIFLIMLCSLLNIKISSKSLSSLAN